MEKYDHKKIEAKWQKRWKKEKLYKTSESQDRPKYYVLDMFPYPSGAGLHVGHPKGYIATDIFARAKMMQGYNVLHPMGWDAFGLPAENYAIQNKVHPRVAMEKNIKTFKGQLEKLGFTYDWEREINTTDPEYYKWTQWTFIKMFERGLAYESYEPINWCPKCQTGLSNEDLEDGKCERCGSEVERKPMRQWMLKITDYADRLLNDLEKLPAWEESIKEMQRNWIGRSEGVNLRFKVKDLDMHFEMYDSIPQTHMAQTFVVIAPDHPKLYELVKGTEFEGAVMKKAKEIVDKRLAGGYEKIDEMEGIFTGRYIEYAPAKRELPIWVASYVVADYGTGVVSCSVHDERDYAFAKKFNIPLHPVLFPQDKKIAEKVKKLEVFYRQPDGILEEPVEFKGRRWDEVREDIIDYLIKNGWAKRSVNYKLRDWVFSRQRYWGEPIPIVHCEKCGNVAVPEKELPLKLPEVKNYEPTGTGESPLANIKEWVNTTCPKCGGPAKRETNTMPQWAGSSWYYLRYIDPHNKKALVDKAKEKYWLPVDFYVGGAEHATRHLIYARFWHKFLFDIGAVNYDEPFTRLQHVGLILAEDGRKMSKRWNNVINPDEIVEKYGADAMRVYEMFMGPFSQPCAWSTNGLIGARRFLESIYKMKDKKLYDCQGEDCKMKESGLPQLLHKTIKKVSQDIESFHYNTAVSQMMIFMNFVGKFDELPRGVFENFLKLLAPFAPHLAEELWSSFAKASEDKSIYQKSIFLQQWPKYNPELVKDEIINLVIQVNSKVRDTIEVEANISEEEAKKVALASEKIKKWIDGKEIVKVIFVKGKLINIVVK